ncbi:MAG: prolyl aminopeptidase [Candidatus Melainabacteria bacterium]|nr:prolyl aminopeptidase [Candidatus Melainabacteria bacterium]
MMTSHPYGPSILWLIRHGLSLSNIAHDAAKDAKAEKLDIDIGNHLVPLSDIGHAQAFDLGAWFGSLPEDERPEVIICSPFLRAVETRDDCVDAAGFDKSKIIFIVDERLREKGFGILDNLTKHGIRKHFPAEAKRFKQEGKFYCQPPGGEAWVDVLFRLRSVREEIRARFPGKRVAIFAHQVVVQCWRLLEEEISVEEILRLDDEIGVPNCGVISYVTPDGAKPFDSMILDKLYFVAPKDAAKQTITTGAKMSSTEKKSPLYQPIEPFCTGHLKVSGRHEIYFEECGNPEGKPVVFVHGGPGGGIAPGHRQFFDPAKYRIILFDQRGCGKSRPYASLDQNTTWDLVEDMEKLRKHFGIDKWQVFGGSWGSTLALAYAETHPEHVSELVLRGIFLVRKQEIDWFYQQGASSIFADAWEPYFEHIPAAERHDLVAAYHKRLTSPDADVRVAAARAWSIWEGSTSKLFPDTGLVLRFADATFAEAFARIECHYFVNRGFMKSDSQLLDDVHKIRHIPTVIVQGRYDVVCPMTSAWDLHRAFPEAEFNLIADAGHSAHEPGITAALVAATDKFAGSAGL